MKGIVVKIQDGCFNDIITLKLQDGTKIESRGWDMGIKGNPILDKGDTVEFTQVYNNLSKCFYARDLKLIKE